MSLTPTVDSTDKKNVDTTLTLPILPKIRLNKIPTQILCTPDTHSNTCYLTDAEFEPTLSLSTSLSPSTDLQTIPPTLALGYGLRNPRWKEKTSMDLFTKGGAAGSL